MLYDADLIGAVLYAADLTKASLTRTKLRGAELIGANLRGAKLDEADLSQAKLMAADLRGAHLLGSKFLNAKVGSRSSIYDPTIFGGSDLSHAVGLESIDHVGPSSILRDAFVLSKGKIPELFLRGCGLSDWEIETVKLYNPDLPNHERNEILYRIYELQTSQSIQISRSSFHIAMQMVNLWIGSVTR